MAGFEPATSHFGGGRTDQLCYTPTFENEESSPSSDGEDDNDIDMLSGSNSEAVAEPYSP